MKLKQTEAKRDQLLETLKETNQNVADQTTRYADALRASLTKDQHNTNAYKEIDLAYIKSELDFQRSKRRDILIKIEGLDYALSEAKAIEKSEEEKKPKTKDIKRLFKLALDDFGREKQMIVAIEEASEFQKELTKVLRNKGNRRNLAEEIADLLIMVNQIKHMYNDDFNELIDEITDAKLESLAEEVGMMEGAKDA